MPQHTALQRNIIDMAANHAAFGTAVNMRSLIKAFYEYSPAAVRDAVKALCTGRTVDGMGLQHVGHGYYELTSAETRAEQQEA